MTTNPPCRILLVEDNPGDARLLHELFRETPSYPVDLAQAANLQDAIDRLRERPFDIILLDLSLPDSRGLDTFRRIRQQAPELPIVLLTGLNDENLGLEAIREGAQDYLIKGQVEPAVLLRAIHYAIERKTMQAKLATLHAQVEQSRDDLLAIFNQLQVGTIMTNEQGQVTFLSRTCQRLLGKQGDTMQGQEWEQLLSCQKEEVARLRSMMQRPPAERTRIPIHLQTTRGKQYWIEVDVQDDPRHPNRKILYLYDVSEIYDLKTLMSEKTQFQNLVGKSKEIQEIYHRILQIAQVNVPVIIEGETGTGKELVARAIHDSSPRRDHPFLAVNCAGLTDSLLGSQLFGHKQGAFTGAVTDHKGFFETAHTGTIFLDEIGDMPLTIQTTLLRALQEKEITRLGESQPRKIDVRVLAATHQPLTELVKEGRFRADLLYRIRVARLHLPALRERREDIPLLVNAFIHQCHATLGTPVKELSHKAIQTLMRFSWPGNIRELKSAVEYALIHSSHEVIQPDDLPPEVLADTFCTGNHPDDETSQIIAALRDTKGNRTAAAQLLGMSRATLYRRLTELGLSSEH